MKFRTFAELVGGLVLLGAALLITLMGDAALAALTPSSQPAAEAGPGDDAVGGRLDDALSQAADRRVHSDPVAAAGRRTNGPRPASALQPVEPKEIGAASSRVRPERIRIPVLGVDAAVHPVVLTADDILDPPSDPGILGWWSGGAMPGADRGTAVIAGHVNTAARGPGALADLDQLVVGDVIIVEGPEQTVTFTVVALEQHRKSRLPASSAFTQSGQGRLAIVSCGGPFDPDNGSYRDNIIAYAVPRDV